MFILSNSAFFCSLKRAYRTQLQTCIICRFYPENFILYSVCLCVKIQKGNRYFRILHSYVENGFLISEARILSRRRTCGLCGRQVFVAVMFLSEYHWSCLSTTVLVRVHLILLSEYHCSCPSTSDLVRVPLFLSEYHWSRPSTAVFVSFFIPPVLHIHLPSTVIDAASVCTSLKNKECSISYYYNVCMQFISSAAHKLSSWVQWTSGRIM